MKKWKANNKNSIFTKIRMHPINLNSLKNELENKYDVFIASSSFEERSLSVTDQIISEIQFNFKFIIAVLHNRPFIQKNLDRFYKEYKFTIADVDSRDQLFTVNNFLSIITDVLKSNHEASFLVDISTFTRQNLLILVR